MADIIVSTICGMIPTLTVKTTASHVLRAVNHAPLDGYGIVRAVRRRTRGRVQLMPGALFSAIRHIMRLGFIEEYDARPFSGVRYGITRLGRGILDPEGIASKAPAAHYMGEGG